MNDLQEFEAYMVHLSEGLGHVDRHAGLRGYCTGLMSPLARKSVEPMAAQVDPLHVRSRHQSLHRFVADATLCGPSGSPMRWNSNNNWVGGS